MPIAAAVAALFLLAAAETEPESARAAYNRAGLGHAFPPDRDRELEAALRFLLGG